MLSLFDTHPDAFWDAYGSLDDGYLRYEGKKLLQDKTAALFNLLRA